MCYILFRFYQFLPDRQLMKNEEEATTCYCDLDTTKFVQTDIDMYKLSELFKQLTLQDHSINNLMKAKICIDSLKNNDTKTKYYTGFPHGHGHFNVLLNIIRPLFTVSNLIN